MSHTHHKLINPKKLLIFICKLDFFLIFWLLILTLSSTDLRVMLDPSQFLAFLLLSADSPLLLTLPYQRIDNVVLSTFTAANTVHSLILGPFQYPELIYKDLNNIGSAVGFSVL